MDNVTIIQSQDIRKDIARLFALYDRTDLGGKKVFIKPNMFRGAGPEESMVTDPKLLDAVVSFCLSVKAHPVVGDNPVPNKGRTATEIGTQCGYIGAAQGCFNNIGRHLRKITIKRGMPEDVHVSDVVLDCDVFISLPKFRSHELTVMSLAVKNSFGIIPGNMKPAFHARFPRIDDFSRILLGIYDIRPPDLIIVDALSFVDGRGKKFKPSTLVCGTNGHAVDYVCARIAGIDPWRVPTLRLARDQREFDPSSVSITGTMPVVKKYHAPFQFPLRGPIVEFFAQWLYYLWLKRRPYIYQRRCAQCGSCAQVCPVHAIHGQRIDYKQCIKCYCCYEICPHSAIQIRMRL